MQNDKLICVEYAPAAPSGNHLQDSLIGCIGEVSEKSFSQAKELTINNKSYRNKSLPVRFPFLIPNSNLEVGIGERDPLNKGTLLEEGVKLPVNQLIPVRKEPVSNYSKFIIKNGIDDIKGLMETDSIAVNYSYDKLFTLSYAIKKEYPYVYSLYSEWLPTGSKKEVTFIESNFYGADTAISIYDKRSFRGVVLEVVVRPFPSKEEEQQGVRICRKRRNVYLFTNTDSFVSYIDGVDIPRWVIGDVTDYFRRTYRPEYIESVRDTMGRKFGSKKKPLEDAGTAKPAQSAG